MLILSAGIILSFFMGAFVYADDLATVLDRSGVGFLMIPNAPEVTHGTTATEKTYFIFLTIIRFLLFLAGVGATVIIIMAGVRMTASAGTPEQIDGAKKMILFAVLGLFACILSFIVIENIVMSIFYD